jgi:hypothetical protein
MSRWLRNNDMDPALIATIGTAWILGAVAVLAALIGG